ncbi:hypothetical protein [Chelatococcus albus]|uniref:hypothetical protein n=1 Tax=Chelatococcus albus TaxID=3047466 RepID=UPI0030ECF250
MQDPLHANFHAPVYKSGDLVELDTDGNFRHVGRKDAQVKIRGYRVNLNEVEDAILRHPDVTEVASSIVETRGARGSSRLSSSPPTAQRSISAT